MTPVTTTPDDPDLIAEELRRRERTRPKRPAAASPDPSLVNAQFEAQRAEIAKIVAETEEQLARQIVSLAQAQGALAETLKKEIAALAARIEKGKETSKAGEWAKLARSLADQERILNGLADRLPAMERRLTASIDDREGAVFSGIDAVAARVTPGADALAALREKLAGSQQAVDDVLKMTDLLDTVATRLEASNRRLGRLKRFGLLVLVLLALLFVFGGVALQRETGIWPPDPDSETAWRERLWERYGEDLKACVEEARIKGQGMLCTVFDMDP